MRWLNTLFRRKRLEKQLDSELRFHLEQQIQENIAAGMPADEARRKARLAFGGLEQAKEECRDESRSRIFEELLQDIRYGFRQLAKSPAVTTAAIVSLAIGIGANTAVFSVVQAVLLKPLPYAQPERLVEVWETFPLPGGRGNGTASIPNFEDWRSQNSVFEHLAAYSPSSFAMVAGSEPAHVSGVKVSDATFPLLGTQPLHGRALGADDFQPGRNHVLVLSYSCWRERFGGDAAVVGKAVRINGLDHEIAGVMPPEFRFPPRSLTEIWTPLVFSESEWQSRGTHWMRVIARLKPSLAIDQAQAEMDVIAERLAGQYPESQEDRGIVLHSLPEAVTGSLRPALLTLWGAVGLVLLIACGNVANLLLARCSTRQREFAVRTAIGAGRGRLIRQLLTESLLLAVAGSVAGTLICVWAIPAMATLPGTSLPRAEGASLNIWVLTFCVLASVLAAVGSGLAPALRTARVDPQRDLKEGGGGSGLDPARDRLRSGLVIAEIALAVVVVIGAGLMLKSFQALQSVDPGLAAESVLTMRVPLMSDRYGKPESAHAFFRELLDRVEALPGVEAAGVIQLLPIQSWGWNGTFSIRGRPMRSVSDYPFAEARRVSENYFRAMGIRWVSGRSFTEQDIRGSARVAIINEALAKQYWPNEDPVGQTIGEGQPESEDQWLTVIGVVANIRNAGFRQPTLGTIYYPYSQAEDRVMSLAVRTSVDPTSLTGAIRQEVRAIDREQPIYDVFTMQEVIARHVSRHRFDTLLFGIFGVLALILAVAGIYGLLAYAVSQRTREIGIRLALGAVREDVVSLILRQGVRISVQGSLLGLLLSLWLGRFLERQLFGVKASDPATLAVVTGGLIVVAVAAAYLPARRAAKLEPLRALRHE